MNGSALNTLLSEPVLLPAGGAMAALFVVLSVLVLRRAGPGSVRLLLPIGGLVVLVLATVFLLERMARTSGRPSGARSSSARLLWPCRRRRPARCSAASTAPPATRSKAPARMPCSPTRKALPPRLPMFRQSWRCSPTGSNTPATTDAGFAERLSGVQRAVELDRFGIAAHVLATRDGCTAERCPTFALLRDTGALKANLRVRAYSEYVARHASAWNTGSPAAEKQPPVANAAAVRCPGSRRPAGGRASPAQPGAESLRLPLGGLDPAGQHHERRAAAAAQRPPPPMPRRRPAKAPPTVPMPPPRPPDASAAVTRALG